MATKEEILDSIANMTVLEVSELVKAMEISYDEGLKEKKAPEQMPHLSPEVEKFLKEMEKRFGSDI